MGCGWDGWDVEKGCAVSGCVAFRELLCLCGAANGKHEDVAAAELVGFEAEGELRGAWCEVELAIAGWVVGRGGKSAPRRAER